MSIDILHKVYGDAILKVPPPNETMEGPIRAINQYYHQRIPRHIS